MTEGRAIGLAKWFVRIVHVSRQALIFQSAASKTMQLEHVASDVKRSAQVEYVNFQS